jgi:hypothetical protein
MTEEHPRHRCHAVSRKLSAPLGRGTEGHPRGSIRGNGLLTGRFLGLRLPGMAECPIGTSDDRRHYSGDDSMQFQPHAQNPHRGGGDDHEGRSLSTEGSDPKAFGAPCTMLVFRDIFRHQALTFRM